MMQETRVILYRLLLSTKRTAANTMSFARAQYPSERRRRTEAELRRAVAEGLLADLANNGAPAFRGRVLIDAMYDNPSYWMRLSLFRKALGLAHADEAGIIGPYNRQQARRTLRNIGIPTSIDLIGMRSSKREARVRAKKLLSETKKAEDIFLWSLPNKFPGKLVYDYILKRQRAASLDLEWPGMIDAVADTLMNLDAVDRILSQKVDLVLLSHAAGIDFGVLAWVAASRNIPVILLCGDYGVSRFLRIEKPEDIFRIASSPTPKELADLSSEQNETLSAAGRTAMQKRMSGVLGDVGSQYAYLRAETPVDRAIFKDVFNWNPAKPVVAVYCAHWFDSPHIFGMKNFRDFLDWIEITLDIAMKNTDVNWLFKNHPCEDWYAGITMHDLLSSRKMPPHIGLVNRDWNNADVLKAVDGVITCHGTVGMEAAVCGMPVVVADVGPYHECPFVQRATNREHYEKILQSRWWDKVPDKLTQRSAEAFVGLYFCNPEWQGDFVFPDEVVQGRAYEVLPDLIARNTKTVAMETALISEWFAGHHSYYHIYKMLNATAVSEPPSTAESNGQMRVFRAS